MKENETIEKTVPMIEEQDNEETQVSVINDENFDQFIGLDAVAVSWAHPGAMGCPGEVDLVTSRGEWYSTNYAFGCMSEENLIKVLPILGECNFGIVGNDDCPDGWTPYYMGAGNHLLIRADILPDFNECIKEVSSAMELYGCWPTVVDYVLKNRD